MKHVKHLLATMAMLLCCITVSAHDFEVDGIYYNITSEEDLTVAVTFRGNLSDAYARYSGSITLSATVTYEGVAYRVTSIGESAFSYCRSLTDITIPEGVTSIGDNAFWGCESLTAITIPEGVTSIGEFAFRDCSSLTDINIPESVTSIGARAFMYCSNLTDINIPKGVASIGEFAFSYCRSLTDITIPESVTSIGSSAFYNCWSLTAISIPDGVTSIGDDAFKQCSSLTYITLPKGVTRIGAGAFEYCSHLTAITCHAVTPPTIGGSNTFNGVGKSIPVYVPAGSVDAYKTTAPWSGFGTIKAIENEIREKCETPTFSYMNGKVSLACETEGAEVVTTIEKGDDETHKTLEFELIPTYTITAYATKAKYETSDVVTVTLCWITCTEHHETGDEDGIITIPSQPMLISTQGGTITLTGLADDTDVAVYTTAGTQLGTTTAVSGTATITTSLTTGDVAIVKIGNSSIKVVVK